MTEQNIQEQIKGHKLMKNVMSLSLGLIVLGFSTPSMANVVIVDSYVILNAVSEGAAVAGQKYYDVKRDSGAVNPDFNNSDLGTFNILSTPVTVGGTTYSGGSLLQLKGAEIKTTATGGDYQNANNFGRMFYAITPSSVSPNSFTQFDLGFRGEAPVYPNYKWDTTGATVNLLSSVSTPGTYRLTVYFESNGSWWNGSSQQFFGISPDNNGGSNYSATFTAIPEPSSASSVALGAAGLLALRRRRKN